MPTYYLLDRFGPRRWIDDWPYIEDIDWKAGARHASPVPELLEFPLKRLNPDSADHSPEMPEYFTGQIPLFREELIRAMVAGGVDNLDLYDAVVIDPDNGKRHMNYKAVNIIGLITAADMGKSQATVHPGGALIDVDFDSLVVDSKNARGALIFRLAESTNAILVHQKLKDHLQARGFNALQFLDPSKCAL